MKYQSKTNFLLHYRRNRANTTEWWTERINANFLSARAFTRTASFFKSRVRLYYLNWWTSWKSHQQKQVSVKQTTKTEYKLNVGLFHLGCSFENGDLTWYPAKVFVDFIPDSNRSWYVNISWTPLTGIAMLIHSLHPGNNMHIPLTGLLVFPYTVYY